MTGNVGMHFLTGFVVHVQTNFTAIVLQCTIHDELQLEYADIKAALLMLKPAFSAWQAMSMWQVCAVQHCGTYSKYRLYMVYSQSLPHYTFLPSMHQG